MKIVRVNLKIGLLLKFLHANWTILLNWLKYIYTYKFAYFKPLVNTKVVESVNTGQHATEVSIFKLILTYCTPIL